jgi:RimJ/RimL family protein N-acetyltransferase
LTNPPYRLETERLVLRCWELTDAPKLNEAASSSLDHLRPWMPWAATYPQPVSETVEVLRGFRGRFDLGQDFVYGVFSRDESEVVGGTGLHTRQGAAALEIGYWIRESRTGEGLATELSAALTRVAFELCGADRVLIRCEPANERSMAIPRKLGYVEEARLRARLQFGDERRDAVIFSLFRDGYGGTPAASAQIEAFDALGGRLL